MESSTDWLIWAVLIGFTVIGALIVVLGISLIRRALRFGRSAVQVMGTVVDVRTIRSLGRTEGPGTTYQPVFEFETPGGMRARGALGSYGANTFYSVNSQLLIWVDFAHPDLVLESSGGTVLTGVVCLVIGAAMVGLPVFAVLGGLG